jgi:hypothetical protein
MHIRLVAVNSVIPMIPFQFTMSLSVKQGTLLNFVDPSVSNLTVARCPIIVFPCFPVTPKPLHMRSGCFFVVVGVSQLLAPISSNQKISSLSFHVLFMMPFALR